MNENFEYKIATKEDIDAIVQFLAKDYYETSRALKDPCKMIFLAYSGEVIIGILELLDLSNISFVYVSEDYQDTLVQEELLELAERFVTKELTAYTDEEHLSFFKQHDYSVDVESNGRYLLKKTIPVLPRFSDYDQVLAFIEAQKDRVYSLTNFKNFMYDFYDPQTKLTCVHIGGTNGKGSTTNYTKEVLKCAGYKVGTFTSPALVNRLDIIRVNDKPIDEATIVRYANRYMDDWMAYELSKFEIEVFIAVMYFIEQGVDIALFEVGLGGTLDATNIISPILTVNTNIGLDHINFLGNTYASIARSKAGSDLLTEARDSGYIYMEDYTKMDDLKYIQPNHFNMQTTMIGKIVGLKLCTLWGGGGGSLVPKYNIKKLYKASKGTSKIKLVRTVIGTVKRIIKGSI